MEKTIEIPNEFRPLFDDGWREAAVYGGRFSLKSHSVARFLLICARLEKTRVACFREFQNSIAESSHQLLSDLIKTYELNDFVVTDKAIVNRINGSDFLFKGLWHNEQSIKSIEGIDVAWVEEAQTVSGSSIDVLTPTVRKPGSKIIYTYNRLLEEDPVHKRLVIEGRPNTLVINVNYDIAVRHNMMPEVVRLEIEDDKEKRPALYKSKWLGEPGSSELRIYNGWSILDELPEDAKLVRRGLDFGFTNDPAAIVDVFRWNGGYILDEVLYQKGVHNNTLAEIIKGLDPTVTIGDSSEPKSIDEIRMHGVSILPAIKGPGSVKKGIDNMQSQQIRITKRSTNLLKEYRGYLWLTDREGKTLNDPQDWDNHALDAARYAISSMNPNELERKAYKFVPDEAIFSSIGL